MIATRKIGFHEKAVSQSFAKFLVKYSLVFFRKELRKFLTANVR